jgi:hypothetical protein
VGWFGPCFERRLSDASRFHQPGEESCVNISS